MEILRFDESTPAAPKKRGLKSAIGISGIAALFAIGSTFAATTTIAVNGGNPIELGQGVQSLVTCDRTITVTTGQSYLDFDSSTAVDMEFALSGIVISNLNKTSSTADDSGCGGKSLVVKSYDLTGAQTGYALVNVAAGAGTTLSSFGLCAKKVSSTDCNAPVLAADVKTITVESQDGSPTPVVSLL